MRETNSYSRNAWHSLKLQSCGNKRPKTAFALRIQDTNISTDDIYGVNQFTGFGILSMICASIDVKSQCCIGRSVGRERRIFSPFKMSVGYLRGWVPTAATYYTIYIVYTYILCMYVIATQSLCRWSTACLHTYVRTYGSPFLAASIYDKNSSKYERRMRRSNISPPTSKGWKKLRDKEEKRKTTKNEEFGHGLAPTELTRMAAAAAATEDRVDIHSDG